MVTNHKAKTHSGFTKGEENKIRAYHQETQFTKEHSNRVKNIRITEHPGNSTMAERKRYIATAALRPPAMQWQESTCQ